VPAVPDETTRAYVVAFGDNDIAVLDLDPQSPTRNHVIERIGFPSPTPR
jgi:DNA-binding beta-propeller fold protein YncE